MSQPRLASMALASAATVCAIGVIVFAAAMLEEAEREQPAPIDATPPTDTRPTLAAARTPMSAPRERADAANPRTAPTPEARDLDARERFLEDAALGYKLTADDWADPAIRADYARHEQLVGFRDELKAHLDAQEMAAVSRRGDVAPLADSLQGTGVIRDDDEDTWKLVRAYDAIGPLHWIYGPGFDPDDPESDPGDTWPQIPELEALDLRLRQIDPILLLLVERERAPQPQNER